MSSAPAPNRSTFASSRPVVFTRRPSPPPSPPPAGRACRRGRRASPARAPPVRTVAGAPAPPAPSSAPAAREA
eukprot:1878083-Prymnesium_polylepis.1